MIDDEITTRADNIRTTGYTVLKNVVPKNIVATMRDAFWPLYDANLDTIKNDPNRGPMRYYIILPFAPPFYQSALHANADIIAIVRRIRGNSAYCTQFASDTPAKGSVY
jgi:hypothetical protein